MPCRDFYDDNPQAYYADTIKGLQKQISFAESALCAVLKAGDKLCENKSNFYTYIDFDDAGITSKELAAWQKKHRELDEKHRAEEAEKKRVAALKKSALSKLSNEERKVLGIKS